MDSDVAVTFLARLFLHAEGDVYISSLPNERGAQPPERHIITRDPGKVAQFCKKWNQPGRGLFFAVSTLRPGAQPTERGSLRCKANASQLPAIHVDIDFDKVITPADNPQAFVINKLEGLKIPPSIITASGGGVHAYWLLDEPVEIAGEADRAVRAERVMRALANLVGGDPAVCEVARLMRLPGSTNSKRDEAKPVMLLKIAENSASNFQQLEDMAKGEPVIEQAAKASPVTVSEFEAYAQRAGIKAPIDTEEWLAAMRHEAGEHGVHNTQLKVTASLISAGMPLEEVVEKVFQATQAVAPADWNMPRERAKIVDMGKSWQAKRAEAVAIATADPGSNVRQLKPKPKPPTTRRKLNANELGPIVGEMVRDSVAKTGAQLLLAGTGLHLYDPGPASWRPCGPEDRITMEVIMHRVLTEEEQFMAKAMDAAWRYLMSHPDLHKPDIVWNAIPGLPVRNGVLDLATRELQPHRPENYITRKLDVDYDPAATAEPFLEFLDRTFSTYSSEPTIRPDGSRMSERTEIVTAYLEFLGASLKVSGLARAQRCGLWLHGASNSGKSELGAIVRGLIGGSIASPSVKDLNGDFGLRHVHGKSALITDEAAQSSDVINENRFKVLVTGEPVDVAIKGKEPITGYQFDIPVVLIGNSLPKVSDETQALFNRSIVIRCARVFSAEEVVELHRQLGVVGPSVGSWLIRECGSGILNLALDARDRLMRRGRYEITPLIALGREGFRQETSLVHAFLSEAVTKDTLAEESRDDVVAAFHAYEIEQGVQKRYRTSAKMFWNKLKNAAPYCNVDSRKSGKVRYVKGIELNAEGIRLKMASDNLDT